MSVRRTGGQIKLILSGVLLAAILLLVGLQWSVQAEYDLLGHRDSAPTIWVVLIGAVLGPVFLWLVKLLLSGMSDLRATRSEAQLKELETQAKEQAKAKAPAPEPQEPPAGGEDGPA